jgi:2,6-dihydroxypyridine 3-monooxygenase
MALPLHVGVVGGSLGGLNAALWLRDAGCDVTVLERSPVPLSGVGHGIVLNPATLRWFGEKSGLALDEISVVSQDVRYIDFRGNIIVERAEPYRFATYDALHGALLNAFGRERYLLGRAVKASLPNGAQVVVTLEKQPDLYFDMVVGADGVLGHQRQAQIVIAPSLAPEYVGYVAWRGTVSAEDVPAELFNALFNAVTVHVMPFGHMLAHPLPGSSGANGMPHLNWIWYRDVEPGAPLTQLMTNREGQLRNLALSPGEARDEAVFELWQDAEIHLPPLFHALVTKTAQPSVQAIVEAEPLRLADGRICRVGDAGFVARPHVGAGAAKAAEDGYTLAQVLRTHNFEVRDALKSWSQQQMLLGRSVVHRAREAGIALQTASWDVGGPLPFGLREAGDSVMR